MLSRAKEESNKHAEEVLDQRLAEFQQAQQGNSSKHKRGTARIPATTRGQQACKGIPASVNA